MPIPLVTTLVRALVRATNKSKGKQAVTASKKKERNDGEGREGAAIRSAALVLAILCSSSVALAKDYSWKDAKVIDITSERGRAVITPIAVLVGVPATKTFYWIQTDDAIYVLGPAVTKRQLLNVTLYEPTKVAIDGNNAHILDDYGRDRKMPVIERVARPKPEDAQQQH